jgi:hypothetical protein
VKAAERKREEIGRSEENKARQSNHEEGGKEQGKETTRTSRFIFIINSPSPRFQAPNKKKERKRRSERILEDELLFSWPPELQNTNNAFVLTQPTRVPYPPAEFRIHKESTPHPTGNTAMKWNERANKWMKGIE